MKKALTLSVICVGFTAMASQIVLVRELLTVFYGNELTIGFILASWLIGGAIGSAGFGRFADRIKPRLDLFLSCQIILGILLPLNIIAIRCIKVAIHINPGEIIPLTQTVVSALLVLLPVSIILGLMFSLACRVYDLASVPAAGRIGRVYVLEAIGSALGGLTASLVLIRLIDSISIMAFLAILNGACALVLSLVYKEIRSKAFFLSISAFLLATFVMMWPLKTWERLDRSSLGWQWHGHELVAAKNSIYGNIAIAKRGDEFSFFNNGLRIYTVPDRQTAEEGVHFALLECADPKEVLLVGGGTAGMVEEALKHPVKSVDYVEMDPLIIDMAKEFLPDPYLKPLSDDRVSIINLDGGFFIKNTDKRYDCVIVNVGDPLTAEANRYYTVEFFNEIKRLLRDDGVVSFTLTASEDYINTELADFLCSIYATLKAVFPDVKVIPGNAAHFLASRMVGTLTYDIDKLMEKAGERRLELKYVREYYLSARLSRQRIDYMNGILKAHAPKNHDFRPVAYYYDMIFWASHFRDSIFKKLLKAVTEHKILAFMFGLSGLIVFMGFLNPRHEDRFPQATLAAVASSGLSMLAFQMIILLAFQMIYGYLFYKLGLLLTSFMIGLAVGGWWSVRIMPSLQSERRSFVLAQCGLVAYLLILPLILLWQARMKSGPASWMAANIIFPTLPVIAGLIGAFQFTLAAKICLGPKGRVGHVSGMIYGVDLAGSCLGALATGIFLIPLLGIPHTCAVLAMLNLSVLVLLWKTGTVPKVDISH